MRKVIHLLPYDGIGGAETAARSMSGVASNGLEFHVRYLFPKVQSSQQRRQTNNPLTLLAGVRAVLREKPDLLIVSLWRSCVAGVLIRLVRPRTRLVVLIHNSADAHWLDYYFTRFAMLLSCAIWADSAASMELRFRRKPAKPVIILPFLIDHLEPQRNPDTTGSATPHFIFWGRLVPQKNLMRALGLFHRIWKNRPHARFTVIGPDGGELAKVLAKCNELGVTSAVQFFGALSFAEILEQARHHAFYLQTSSYEGMAMSVVEAMQMGLLPVVTPVGEIGCYCNDGFNAVVIDSDEQTAASILRLLDDPETYAEMCRNAIKTWEGRSLYRDAVIDECLRLLNH